MMTIPQVRAFLPEYLLHVTDVIQECESGTLNSWPQMAARVRTFFTPSRLDQVDRVIPGWREMAAYANNSTLIHVTAVLAALLRCPEYQAASEAQQALMQWIVLFHDVGKQIEPGQRDHTHGFRSAAMTGTALPRLGFMRQYADDTMLNSWEAMTRAAITTHDETGTAIQDNRKLPAITEGIDTVFGTDTTAALIVKTVLFHMSLTVVQDWPAMAPLTNDEIRQYIHSPLVPLLEIMMLVDNDAWAFFDAEVRQRHRAETLATFQQIRQIVRL